VLQLGFKPEKTLIKITNFVVSTNSSGSTDEVLLENFINNMESVKVGRRHSKKMLFELSDEITTRVTCIIGNLDLFITDSEDESF
jgi:hypothetical protein